MKPLHLLLAIAVTCLWGFNFSVIKAGVDTMDPFIVAALRFTFAALPLIFFVRKPDVGWGYLVGYGVVFGVGVWGMMSLSIAEGLSAGMAGVILEASAFISVILGVVILRERLTTSSKLGLLLSLAGLAMVFSIEDGSVTTTGAVLAVIAAISLSAATLLIKKANIKEMFSFVVWSSLFAPLPLFAIAYLTSGSSGFVALIGDFNQTAFASVLFQAYPTTVIGYWIWNRLLTIYPLTTMGPLKLLIPIFALLGSVIFYDEQIAGDKLIACGLIIAGVALPIFFDTLSQVFNRVRHAATDASQ
ncbi:hypothetical protein A9R01_15360 ['Osedax' symbiont bacterium Rs2_46_30_T18]|nr:hypothetical protein A9R01_15360 ['Osedax' symbiont bacterium Rs2_46_30_T18]